MDIQTIVSELKGERNRIDQAISAYFNCTPTWTSAKGDNDWREASPDEPSRTQAHLRRYKAAMGKMEGKV